MSAPGATLIEARGVGVRLDGRGILTGIDLQVRSGEILALVGPNGAGKSTLLSVLSGDASPSEGEVTLLGRPIGDYRALELARLRSVLTQPPQVRLRLCEPSAARGEHARTHAPTPCRRRPRGVRCPRHAPAC